MSTGPAGAAPKLGKDGAAPPIGAGVISATFVEECEAIEITNRDNDEGGDTLPGFRIFDAGFKSQTWEIECHDPTGLLAALEAQLPAGTPDVVSITENASIDGAMTYTVTLRRG
jgi:hypothetical protein